MIYVGEVSTESEETSSGKESVPRAYITADLKQVVLTYDQVAPIELEGLEIKKISILVSDRTWVIYVTFY